MTPVDTKRARAHTHTHPTDCSTGPLKQSVKTAAIPTPATAGQSQHELLGATDFCSAVRDSPRNVSYLGYRSDYVTALRCYTRACTAVDILTLGDRCMIGYQSASFNPGSKFN